jgi:hypothetical protein
VTTFPWAAIIRPWIVKRTRRGHMVRSLGYSRFRIALSTLPATSNARTFASTLVHGLHSTAGHHHGPVSLPVQGLSELEQKDTKETKNSRKKP